MIIRPTFLLIMIAALTLRVGSVAAQIQQSVGQLDGVGVTENLNAVLPLDATALVGEELFTRIGCTDCHIPSLTSSRGPVEAYTDLLLHDMGEGLADGRAVFDASGREWRTPPLWGLGLVETVNGHSDLLHDGRARNVTEAILWHGGEGAASRERFEGMSAAERADLVRFVNSI